MRYHLTNVRRAQLRKEGLYQLVFEDLVRIGALSKDQIQPLFPGVPLDVGAAVEQPSRSYREEE